MKLAPGRSNNTLGRLLISLKLIHSPALARTTSGSTGTTLLDLAVIVNVFAAKVHDRRRIVECPPVPGRLL